MILIHKRNLKKISWNRKAISKALHTFALSVGATAVCMVASLSFLKPEAPLIPQSPTALEASVFNGGKELSPAAGVSAYTEAPGKVIPLGSVFGIKLFTDGVIVASLSEIYTETGLSCPAAEAGLKPGDYLLQADGMEIPNNAALAKYIGSSAGKPITLQVNRDGEIFEADITPVFGDGAFKAGMWVRDSAAGIGTLTFYDPSNGMFAGLGHGICDTDSSRVMPLKTGEPAPITLCGITKGLPENPGQLKGYFSSDDCLGQLLENNETGVFGMLNEAPQGEGMELLSRKEVKTGPVEIMATLDERGPQLYKAEIAKINSSDSSTKNLILKITDERLLEKTGGIVQGMSGCPIIQDGKLAGAVTHVFTQDPTMGYGIFAQTMWEVSSTTFSMSRNIEPQ